MSEWLSIVGRELISSMVLLPIFVAPVMVGEAVNEKMMRLLGRSNRHRWAIRLPVLIIIIGPVFALISVLFLGLISIPQYLFLSTIAMFLGSDFYLLLRSVVSKASFPINVDQKDHRKE